MTSGTSLPKLWLSVSNHTGSAGQSDARIEKDCDGACPSPLDFNGAQVQPLFQQVSVGSIQDVRISEDVFLDHIEDYAVALSAIGAHIVVMDGQAKRLFSYLDGLSSVQALRQVIPWPNDVVEQVIALLLAESILLSPQTARPDTIQDGSTTLTAWLHLTNGCNLSCSYCYLALNGRHMDLTTTRRAVDSIYRSALAHGYSRVKLKYAGGEPTLNFKALLAAQQQAEILSVQTNISLETVMLTNGVRLKDDQIDELLSHNIRVMVSLDGMGEFHNVQRPLAGQNKPSFEHVFRTLDRLRERGISPHISITITNKNIGGLPSLVEYLLDRGLRFSLNFFREPNDLPIYGELSFSPGEIIGGLMSVFRLIERQLPPYSFLSNLSDLADLRMPHSHTCGVGRNYLVINYDGNVAKCQMDIEYPVTTIDVDDPLVLVEADTDGIQNLSVEEKDIRECVWRYRCTGGCPRLTFQHTGRYDSKSPMCEVYEAILPEVVRLEALRLIRYETPWDFRLPFH